MILKGFKEKSIKKYFNKLLDDRADLNGAKPIESLGVIVDWDQAGNLEAFETLAKTLHIHNVKFKLIFFSEDKDAQESLTYPCFNEKDFDWKGHVKNTDLQTFLNTPFDGLISYYFKDDLHLKLLTALSKAEFKIGVLQEEPRLNDLIIASDPKAFQVFKNELLKYLSILKRI